MHRIGKENANRYRAYAVHAPEKLPPKYRSSVIGKDATESIADRPGIAVPYSYGATLSRGLIASR